ncbi:MAG: hypothetical protein CVU27_05655 [Betaproteobacteria bacterium HGW-Betaproteobacteria-20]|nr:MAG: hypothetical protein CVU27_05655 [Betaproteobacteria bacterium HGW-Betaproteobacteria-20]
MKSFRSRVMRFVRHWHARVGVMAAIFFLFLTLSGLALNHTDALGLVKHEVNNTWLMRWYGFKPAVPTHGYLFEDGYFAASGERWVMNGHVLLDQGLSETRQHLVGAIAWGDMRAISSEDHLFLYLPDGTRVDNLSGAALPNTPIKRLGSINTDTVPQLVLETAQGSFVTEDGLAWQILKVAKTSATAHPVWASEQPLPSTLSASLNRAFGPSLPLERIVLDLHSGRIFGRYGPLLMDIAALGLIILSLSGVWIYLRSVRRKPHH